MGAMAAALARLGCRPDIGWLEECLHVSRRGLQLAAAAQLVQLISALAGLRFRPGSTWMQVCVVWCGWVWVHARLLVPTLPCLWHLLIACTRSSFDLRLLEQNHS